MKRITVVLVALLMPVVAWGQSVAPADIVRLQQQVDELRAKLDAANREIATLRGESGTIDTNALNFRLTEFANALLVSRNDVEKQEIAKAMGKDVKTDSKSSLSTIDLRKTDSLLNPIIGEITWSKFQTIDSKEYHSMSSTLIKIQVAPAKDGSWSGIRGFSTIQMDDGYPRSQTDNSKVGRTTELTKGTVDEWIKLATTQKKLRR